MTAGSFCRSRFLGIALWALSAVLGGSSATLAQRVGLEFWPLDPATGQARARTEGIEVRLAPEGEVSKEIASPCCVPFQPPPGKYKTWLEGEWEISSTAGIVLFRGGEGASRPILKSLVPAGRVALDASVGLRPGEEVRLLHLDSHNQGPRPRAEMSRAVPASGAPQGELMPAGDVLAVLLHPSTGNYRAVSRPLRVAAGKTTTWTPQPIQGTDLIVVLDRPQRVASFERYDVNPTVSLPGAGPRAADVKVRTVNRVYAVWYGLEDRYGTLDVDSPTVTLEPVEVPLRPGKVERIRARLRNRPDLTVELRLPPGVDPPPGLPRLTVSRPLSRTVLAEGDAQVPGLDSDASRTVLADLPSEELAVFLDWPPLYAGEVVDLSDGEDREILLQPPALVVTGRVLVGHDPQAARVTFTHPKGPSYSAEVRTDEDGAYRVTLVPGGSRIVAVALAGEPRLPYREMKALPREGEATLDLHLPDNRFRVQVVDEETGAPISGAEVRVGTKSRDGHGGAQSARTDADGRADLQPVQEGQLEILATAEGYLASQMLERAVSGREGREDIRIELRAIHEGQRLQILLPSGLPAGRAEALTAPSLEGSVPAWTGVADEEGFLEVPELAAGGYLLIRHPAAATWIERWPGSASTSSSEVRSLRPAAAPLHLQAMQSWGDPVPRASAAVEVEGAALFGSLLRWVCQGNVADALGALELRSLPAGPIRVLMAPPGRTIQTGDLARWGRALEPPWPPLVEVEVIP